MDTLGRTAELRDKVEAKVQMTGGKEAGSHCASEGLARIRTTLAPRICSCAQSALQTDEDFLRTTFFLHPKWSGPSPTADPWRLPRTIYGGPLARWRKSGWTGTQPKAWAPNRPSPLPSVKPFSPFCAKNAPNFYFFPPHVSISFARFLSNPMVYKLSNEWSFNLFCGWRQAPKATPSYTRQARRLGAVSGGSLLVPRLLVLSALSFASIHLATALG